MIRKCFKALLCFSFNFKKNIMLFLFLLFVITLVGCQKKEFLINVIEPEEIFLQNEKQYYVYFYKDNCFYCDEVFDEVNEYLKNPTEKKLFVCKLEEEDVINGKAEGFKGQGPDGKYFVDGVTEYQNLLIAGVPSLIRISGNGYSFYVTSGKNNIKEYFEKLNELNNEN